MMGHREKLINGDEVDCVLARDMYCYLDRAGTAHKIKKHMSRRYRHEAKRELRRGYDN